MKQNDFTKSSVKLHELRKALYNYIRKATKRDDYIDELVESRAVSDFRDRVFSVLIRQKNTISEGTIRRALDTLAKIDQEDLERVRGVINDEFGSFERFLADTEILDFLVVIYNESGRHVMDKMDIVGVFNLKDPNVIDKLRDRVNFLIRSVDDTTKDQLSRLIVEGYEDGLGWQQIAERIDKKFPDIARYRAEMIARMETANAVNLAELDFYDRNGITERRWVLAKSHQGTDVCDDNAQQGAVKGGRSFFSGDDAPPAHVNCMCTLEPVIPDDFIENGPMWLGE